MVQKGLQVFLITQLVHKEYEYLYTTVGNTPHDSSPCYMELQTDCSGNLRNLAKIP